MKKPNNIRSFYSFKNKSCLIRKSFKNFFPDSLMQHSLMPSVTTNIQKKKKKITVRISKIFPET